MASQLESDSLALEKALKNLSPTINSSSLYKLLTFIRKSVEWPKHRKNILKVYESGCIKKILYCLNSSQSNIIAVSLSILGNCCLEFNCAREVAYRGMSNLYHLVQKCSGEDSINGRVFRIIGNICQHYPSTTILQSKGHIVSYIIKFIQKYADEDDTKISETTMLMALRALGKLMNRHTCSSLVDKYEMLKSIGAIFIKCSMRWTSQKENEALLEHLLKFLYVFSKYRYPQGISQLRSASNGNCLIYLSQVIPLAPQLVVNIVMNFMSVSQLKSEIPIQDIIACFVKLLKESPLKNDEIDKQQRDYIKCLCFLLDDPINRGLDRCHDTIHQLIRVLEDVKNPSNDTIELLCLILETFERCGYHTNIMKLQLENNMIDVLVNKIETVLGSRKYLKIIHKKEKIKFVPGSTAVKKHFWDSLPDSSDEEIELPKTVLPSFRPSTPGSGSDSEIMISPWSSPRASTPPVDVTKMYLQESDSEDYSPVCSENEEKENTDQCSIQEGDSEDFTEMENICDTDDTTENIENISKTDLKYRLVYHSLSLLRVYSCIQPVPAQLCSDSLMMMMTKCACYFEMKSVASSSATYVIMRILSVHDHLMPLMKTSVIYSIFSLLKTDHGCDCRICYNSEAIAVQILEKFTALIESGGGRGAIAHTLMCGPEKQKQQLVMAIPYIVKCRTTLHTLMINCKGMKILAQCLNDENQRKKCLQVICVLVMKHLTMLNSNQRTCFSREEMYIENYIVPEDCKNKVTFVLDDNSCLSADRDTLCEKSCYFNTLLNGAFKESNENFVKLQETSYRSLECLMNLLHCDLDMSQPRDIQVETHTLLDVILLCHRYLLEELCDFLTTCVRQYCLSAENLPIIYKWSIESGTDILRLDTVTYALKGSKDICDKISMFMKLFKIGYTDKLIEDIEKLLSNYIILSYKRRYN